MRMNEIMFRNLKRAGKKKLDKKTSPNNMATESNQLTLLDRMRGSFFGSAIGDCLGTTLEFTSRSDREKDWINDSKD